MPKSAKFDNVEKAVAYCRKFQKDRFDMKDSVVISHDLLKASNNIASLIVAAEMCNILSPHNDGFKVNFNHLPVSNVGRPAGDGFMSKLGKAIKDGNLKDARTMWSEYEAKVAAKKAEKVANASVKREVLD